MNEILGIEVPSSFEGLDADQTRTVLDAVREAVLAAAQSDAIDSATLAGIKIGRTFVADARAHLATIEATEDEVNAELDSIVAEMSGDVDPGDDPPEPDEDDDDEDDDGDGGDGAEEEVPGRRETERSTERETEHETVTASTTFRRRTSARSVAQNSPEPAANVPLAPEFVPMTVATGVNGFTSGEAFESTHDLARALINRWQSMGQGDSQKHDVGIIQARFRPEQMLGDDTQANIAKFGGLDPLLPKAQAAITAAVCAPAEPYYGLGCESSEARPVKAALPSYNASRGNVSVYPSPKLSDFPGAPGSGYGIWTQDDDADPNAVKKCATIPCATPINYGIYGIWRCLTIKNMNAMTYPELVQAYLNKLGALYARMAEVALLDAAINSVNTKQVTVTASDEGASINTLATMLNVIAVYREEERLDSVNLRGFGPRWARDAIKIDMVRQRRTSSTSAASRVPSDAEVDALFSAAGVNMTWTLDNATGWDGIDSQADGADLVKLPTSASFFLTPVGNIRYLDGGRLTIGVTNNNIYRDNASNSRNEFTIFMEEFEGLIDFGCVNYHVNIDPFCPNGAQVADVTAITC